MLSSQTNRSCPLCGSKLSFQFAQDQDRTYRRCYHCLMVFVPKEFHVGFEREKAEYELHQNHADEAYLTFLKRLAEPLLKELAPHHRILDFGCGPGPVLSEWLQDKGYQVEVYDPFFHDRPEVLNQQYDVVTMTEVVEHLRNPAETLQQVWTQVKPGGLLALMTSMLPDRKDFDNWHYKRDVTHICFYTPESFQFLAKKWSARLQIPRDNVVFLHKSTANQNP